MPDIYQYPSAGQQKIKEGVQEWTAEKIVLEKGIFIHLKGCQFPQKGMPTPEAVSAIGHIKKIVKTFHIFIWSAKRFEDVCWPIISPFILKEEFQMGFTKEMQKFFPSEKSALIISHIFEYDWAYRLRLQDLFSETTKDILIQSPIQEILRLRKLNLQRDYPEVSAKFSHFLLLLSCLIFLPSIRRSFKNSLRTIDFKKLQFDEADRYWALQRIEYDTMGKTFEERKKMLSGYEVAVPKNIEYGK